VFNGEMTAVLRTSAHIKIDARVAACVEREGPAASHTECTGEIVLEDQRAGCEGLTTSVPGPCWRWVVARPLGFEHETARRDARRPVTAAVGPASAAARQQRLCFRTSCIAGQGQV
jgi:hypothetical protein